MTALRHLGATSVQEKALAELGDAALVLGRVAKSMRKHCDVWTSEGEITARVPKRVFRAATGAPVVGDFVAVDPERERLHHVFERRTSLSRKAAGRVGLLQMVAANVDTAFIIVGLDRDFNLRRVERYLAITWQGNVQPVVLLNKCDLDHASTAEADVVRVAAGAPVHRVSAKAGIGLEAIDPFLQPSQTVALLGSSGVGKSTLVNHLVGSERMRTASVRARDDRGRHTTTHRELISLTSGALLIDTPGMRELGLMDHADGVAEAFSDVETLRAACRFANCGHDGEPGCAIAAALEDGTLDPSRLASYRKLRTEVDAATVRREKHLQEVATRTSDRARKRKLR